MELVRVRARGWEHFEVLRMRLHATHLVAALHIPASHELARDLQGTGDSQLFELVRVGLHGVAPHDRAGVLVGECLHQIMQEKPRDGKKTLPHQFACAFEPPDWQRCASRLRSLSELLAVRHGKGIANTLRQQFFRSVP